MHILPCQFPNSKDAAGAQYPWDTAHQCSLVSWLYSSGSEWTQTSWLPAVGCHSFPPTPRACCRAGFLGSDHACPFRVTTMLLGLGVWQEPSFKSHTIHGLHLRSSTLIRGGSLKTGWIDPGHGPHVESGCYNWTHLGRSVWVGRLGLVLN